MKPLLVVLEAQLIFSLWCVYNKYYKPSTPTWTRTRNNRLEIYCYIPLTIEAFVVKAGFEPANPLRLRLVMDSTTYDSRLPEVLSRNTYFRHLT